MTVTVAKGFVAAGVKAGIKKSGAEDLALVVNQGPLKAAAAVFTTNRCQANPVLWSKEVIKDGQVEAIVLNSGGANCYTGPQGFQTTHSTAEAVASNLGVAAADVLVCSTGLRARARRPSSAGPGRQRAAGRARCTSARASRCSARAPPSAGGAGRPTRAAPARAPPRRPSTRTS